MTILCPEALTNLLDLIEDGASVVEASAAIGCAPKSKIVFAWLKASEEAGEFEPPPVAPWAVMRGDKSEWFHIAYRAAVANGRANRAMRSPAIRRELEERVEARRAGRAPAVEPSMAEQQAPPAMIIEHARRDAVVLDPKPPAPRPSYAYRAPPLDAVHGENGPPLEGRFSMVRDRPKSQRERQAGLPEITDLGVKVN